MSSSTTSENRERKLTIIVSSPPAVGHVNACAGALRGALARGHRIIFVINRMFEGKLAKLGYKEHLFSMPNKDASMNEAKENPGEAIAALFQAAHIIGPYSPLEKLRSIMATFDQREQLADALVFDAAIKEAAELYKPDLFYVDNELMPAVYYSGVPWVRSISIHPLFFYEGEEVLPPGGGGLGMDSDPSTWAEWTELRRNWHQSTTFNSHGKFGTYLESMNIRDSSECRCGGVQTPMHLVFDCRFFLQEREQLKRQIEEKGELFEEDQIHHLIINSSIRKRLFRFFNLIHQKLLVWDRDPL